MRERARASLIWVAPVALMVVIFWLSSIPSDDPDRGLLVLIARKLAHFSEYALLTVLWARALATRITEERALVAAVAIAGIIILRATGWAENTPTPGG